MQFELHSLHFELQAESPVAFEPGRAANSIRGALGRVLPSAVFSPKLAGGPSGLADPPRPFALRVRALEGRRYEPGDAVPLQINVFDPALTQTEPWEMALERFSVHGARLRLTRIRVQRITVPLALREPSKLRIDFLSPLELKQNGVVRRDAEFAPIFRAAVSRIRTLSTLYGSPVAINLGQADSAPILEQSITFEEFHRQSTRTGHRHALGGITGYAVYGDAAGRAAGWLEAAQHTGIGRHTVWGCGEIEVNYWRQEAPWL